MPVADVDLVIGRHDVDRAGDEPLAVLDGADGQGATPREDLGQMALARGVEVLSDHDGRGEAGLDAGEQGGDSLDATRRRADHHEIEGVRSLRHDAAPLRSRSYVWDRSGEDLWACAFIYYTRIVSGWAALPARRAGA